MSFILNYLDEALDTVTGRYDEHNEENGSEGGSAVGGTNEDEGEGERRPLSNSRATLFKRRKRRSQHDRQYYVKDTRAKGKGRVYYRYVNVYDSSRKQRVRTRSLTTTNRGRQHSRRPSASIKCSAHSTNTGTYREIGVPGREQQRAENRILKLQGRPSLPAFVRSLTRAKQQRSQAPKNTVIPAPPWQVPTSTARFRRPRHTKSSSSRQMMLSGRYRHHNRLPRLPQMRPVAILPQQLSAPSSDAKMGPSNAVSSKRAGSSSPT